MEPYLSYASAFIAYTKVNITLPLPFYSPPTPVLCIPLLRVCFSVVTRRRCVIESETLYWPAEVFNRKACVFMTSRQSCTSLPDKCRKPARARECVCVCVWNSDREGLVSIASARMAVFPADQSFVGLTE